MAGSQVQGKYDTKIETEFSNGVIPLLEELGLSVGRLHHDDVRHVLFVNIALGEHSGRKARHEALHLLHDFEERFGNTVTVEPAFIRHDDVVIAEG
jgi:hypothetical protein